MIRYAYPALHHAVSTEHHGRDDDLASFRNALSSNLKMILYEPGGGKYRVDNIPGPKPGGR